MAVTVETGNSKDIPHWLPEDISWTKIGAELTNPYESEFATQVFVVMRKRNKNFELRTLSLSLSLSLSLRLIWFHIQTTTVFCVFVFVCNSERERRFAWEVRKRPRMVYLAPLERDTIIWPACSRARKFGILFGLFANEGKEQCCFWFYHSFFFFNFWERCLGWIWILHKGPTHLDNPRWPDEL